MLSKFFIFISILYIINNIIPSINAFNYLSINRYDHKYNSIYSNRCNNLEISQPTYSNINVNSKHNNKNNIKMSSISGKKSILIEYDDIGIKKAMRWNEKTNAFQQYKLSNNVKQTPVLNFFKNCFIPSGK